MKSVTHDSETLAQGQQVITACAFIYTKIQDVYKVFLPKRAKTKKFLPDVYELPGGHIEFGEDIIHGLKREINEEFDMEIDVHDAFAAFTYKNQIKKAHAVEVVFFAEFTDPIKSITLHPNDHSGYQWIGKEEIANILTPNKSIDDPEIQAIQKGFTLLEKYNS